MATAPKETVSRDASSIRVEIFDQVYHLRGSDPAYVMRLAEFVDEKMRAVAEQTSTVDSVRLAVLAALNIADEYHLLKGKLGSGGTESSQRARQLSRLLDEVLEDQRRAG
jgi:cell division protein ZapA